jgi:carbon storage regulator
MNYKHDSNTGNLIITRRPGESFWVGDDVEVTIVDLTETKARISIKAPRDVDVLRSELIKRNGRNDAN